MQGEQKRVTLNVEGMTCANCALGISKFLEKKGLEEINTNFSTGEVRFREEKNLNLEEIIEGINNLGFKVVEEEIEEPKGLSPIEKKFYFTLIFTIPLFSHMFVPLDILQDAWFQLALCIPVFVVGLFHFGKSAFGSLKTGVPNMDVLILIGSVSAFVYSLWGAIMFYGTHEAHNYLFFETTATIISLVLLGNVLEHRSVKQTTTAIKELNKLQKTTAKKVTDNGEVVVVEFSEVKVNDIIQVNTGDQIAVDGEIIKGEGTVNESMISGESTPIEKEIGSKVIGGTILENGSFQFKAEKVGDQTVLSKIIEMVKNAQQDKPSIQRLGDKISAIFVPTVVGIALLTFLLSYFVFTIGLQDSLLHSIAVLVISCPCAMGLATPTAVMVGIGRAAKRGILIKGGSTLEQFARIKNIVFDKTGTITTGKFTITKTKLYAPVEEQEIMNILFSLERHSSHPIAQSITTFLKDSAKIISLDEVNELKGIGIEAVDVNGTKYQLVSQKIGKQYMPDSAHSIYVIKGGELIAGVDIEDELKENVPETMELLNKANINTILLSGDQKKKCEKIAEDINIKTVYSEQSPDQKLKMIDDLEANAPTAMVGDGINDAPALAKANVGISLSNATQVAVQSAQMILLNTKDLSQVYEAFLISKHTLITIKQNLFWAFFYNVLAIPIAAMGYLDPMIAALTMAFSDVIVIGNSIRLKRKKLV